MDTIIAFYTHEGSDSNGRTLKEIWNFSDLELEKTHDYIQWIFPTMESSKFNPEAPLLTSESICEFLENEEAIVNLITSSFIFQKFLKLDDEIPFWIKKNGGRDNHNCLRISRVISSLGTLEQHARADSFYQAVLKAYIRNAPSPIYYWQNAHHINCEYGEDVLANEINEYVDSLKSSESLYG